MGDDALGFVVIEGLQACRSLQGLGVFPTTATHVSGLAAVIAMDSMGLQDISAQFLGDCCAEDVFVL